MAVLELSNISYSYELDGQKVPVLTNINLAVQQGDMIAIQGPSGSGKSTLLYLIGCLLRLQEGSLCVDGENTAHFSADELANFRNKKIGFVFQQFHLLSKTNVLQNILLPTEYSRGFFTSAEEAKKKAKHLADLFGLGDRLYHLPNQLSGGQQQRVAIARAMINDPSIILADEPTGNLDSKSSMQIMELLKDLNRQGKTIVIITHDAEVAKHCAKIFHIRDGFMKDGEGSSVAQSLGVATNDFFGKKIEVQAEKTHKSLLEYIKLAKNLLPLALENLYRNKLRTFLTMLGITIGITAVLAMVTLGQFTKQKILDSYAELGVNTLMFYGYPSWDLKATDEVPVVFRFFDWQRDIEPLRTIFPQIRRMSPQLRNWDGKATYGGKVVDQDVRVLGVNSDALLTTRRELLAGKNFSPFHIDNHSSVCIIGYEIAQRLFSTTAPLGEVLQVSSGGEPFGCQVIGVLKPATSNNDWVKPNLQIYLPYTLFQAVNKNWWNNFIQEVLIQVDPEANIESTGKGIRTFFEMKYGKSGHFRVDSDTVLLAQMNKFLTLFTIMLTAIALISLGVGGIGITNMMLVSVSERFREIGLRKALGATDTSIRVQFLLESILICSLAGLLGILLGFASYEVLIWSATKLVPKVKFEWIIDWGALTLSLLSILVVGVLSGFFPALKAERLQVIEALRSE